mmetsp:Transcript_18596/g.27582  ORF Transcript_18596/g.27582 Transcript_18596/m.27582 type:complete len:300 (+) Transcript_18596:129-1028(+)|eukprot:CAMPEP_0194205844 /NCGR_PEP_ID=MMETSP0156-20130528/5035_1 /TAXON_ID=33649 /ORGANISM="Thalassionema nitzschioides, Strain L26-B" /LENGTH=299 /DNA_ID=CAMNT_0038932227 /DNA_START=120 /DNA_END=1019 /DNA_ORIENTATION=+
MSQPNTSTPVETLTANKRTRLDTNNKEEAGRILIQTLLSGYCRFLSSDDIPNSKNDETPPTKENPISNDDIATSKENISIANKKRKVEVITSRPPDNKNTQQQIVSTQQVVTANPTHYLKHILKESTGNVYQDRRAPDLSQFFLEVTPSNIEAYGCEVLTAVRTRDTNALREMLRQGRLLQCCNQFGESILHMACRRGSIDVVRFLVHEAGVCVRVKDDYGRTPLHDAFWAKEPEIELVKLLISICPDLLLVSDVRGFVPLAYVRKEHWGIWCKFLGDHREDLVPKYLMPETIVTTTNN